MCAGELVKAARKGRVASHSPEAEAKRREGRRRHAARIKAWKPSHQPAWLNQDTYQREVQPRLAQVAIRAIRTALGISKSYAANIRSGTRMPHPRHWETLARLVGVSGVIDSSGTQGLSSNETG